MKPSTLKTHLKIVQMIYTHKYAYMYMYCMAHTALGILGLKSSGYDTAENWCGWQS